MEGTNKAHENGEAMGFVGVRLTAQLGTEFCGGAFCLIIEFALLANRIVYWSDVDFQSIPH